MDFELIYQKARAGDEQACVSVIEHHLNGALVAARKDNPDVSKEEVVEVMRELIMEKEYKNFCQNYRFYIQQKLNPEETKRRRSLRRYLGKGFTDHEDGREILFGHGDENHAREVKKNTGVDLVDNSLAKNYEQKDLKAKLKSLFSELTALEKIVIYARYYDGKSLDEIGAAIGKTEGEVREIEAKALRKFRSPKHAKTIIDYKHGI